MSIEYSSGLQAHVYYLTEEQRRLYPSAQLVRKEWGVSFDETAPLRRYYALRIASLLFPQHFPVLVDAEVEPYCYNLYTQEVPLIDPTHAVYSKDMVLSYATENKVSICSCNHCVQHRDFHKRNHLESRARKLHSSLGKCGIILPSDDPSDYCLTEEGLVFFEVDGISKPTLRSYLKKNRVLNTKEAEALELLDEIERLEKQAEDTFRRKILQPVLTGF